MRPLQLFNRNYFLNCFVSRIIHFCPGNRISQMWSCKGVWKVITLSLTSVPDPCELPSRLVSSSLTPTAPIAPNGCPPIAPSKCSVWAQDTPTISIALAISHRRRLRSKVFHHELGPPDCPFCPQFPFMKMLLQGEQDMTPFSLPSAPPVHLNRSFQIQASCTFWMSAIVLGPEDSKMNKTALAFRSSSSPRRHSNRKS